MSYYHDNDGADFDERFKSAWMWMVIICALGVALALLLSWVIDPVKEVLK